jgi:hypothetical protein
MLWGNWASQLVRIGCSRFLYLVEFGIADLRGVRCDERQALQAAKSHTEEKSKYCFRWTLLKTGGDSNCSCPTAFKIFILDIVMLQIV